MLINVFYFLLAHAELTVGEEQGVDFGKVDVRLGVYLFHNVILLSATRLVKMRLRTAEVRHRLHRRVHQGRGTHLVHVTLTEHYLSVLVIVVNAEGLDSVAGLKRNVYAD